MGRQRQLLNCTVTALLANLYFAGWVWAGDTRLDELFEQLLEPELPNWEVIEEEIWLEWSRSGSASMDLLLRRGRDALDAGDHQLAIDHLTALTDHAPDFAEGFNARALAYFNIGLYGPALADLQRVLELNPRHFGALTGLGAIFEQTGEDQRAFDAYTAARAIHPHDPDLKEAIERLEPRVSGVTL